MKDRRLNILHSFGVRWPDITALLYTIKETGGDPNGTPLQKAAFYFREYMALDVAEEEEINVRRQTI